MANLESSVWESTMSPLEALKQLCSDKMQVKLIAAAIVLRMASQVRQPTLPLPASPAHHPKALHPKRKKARNLNRLGTRKAPNPKSCQSETLLCLKP